MQTILAGFLAANLLPIGDDDEKLRLLDAAAADLANQLEATPILAYRFGLCGLDERIPVTDPVCKLVEAAVKSQWQTIGNKIGPDPTQVYRAVLLRALEMVAIKRQEFRYAILLVASAPPAPPMRGKGAEAVDAMLAGFGRSISDEMSRSWVNSVDMSLPKLAAKSKRAPGFKEELSVGLGQAAGPTDKEGRQLANANPHWPNANQAWTQEFVPRAAEAISAAIQAGAKGLLEDMQQALRETVAGWSDALQRLAIRDAKAELLWLRASQYSPTARRTYRDMSPHEVALYAVLDTSRAVAANAPPSVEYFLRDLVTSLTPNRGRLNELLAAIGPKLRELAEGKAIADKEPLPAEGRRSWLDVAVRPSCSHESQFEKQAGVPETFEVSMADMSVMFYRELQIRKLLATTS